MSLRFLAILFGLSAATLLHAQQPLFEQFTRDEGLPTNEIYDMLQDPEGYIYLATDNGISRFNGISFTDIPTAEGEMPSGSQLQQDSKGQLFFMAFDGRLFQIGHDSLQLIMQLQDESRHFPVYSIDEKDQIWISTSENLYCLEGDELKVQTYPYSENWKNQTSHNVPLILSIRDDSLLMRFNHQGRLFHPQTGFQPLQNEWESGNLVFSWQGKRYLCNRDLQDKDRVFTLINNCQISSNNPFYEKLKGIDIVSVQKGFGGIWFATFQGLFFYHPQKGWQNWFKEYVVSEVLIDQKQQLWLSTTSAGLFLIKTPELLHFSAQNSFLYSNEVHALDFKGDSLVLGFDKGHIQELHVPTGRSRYFETGQDLEVHQINYHQKAIVLASSSLFVLDAQRKLHGGLIRTGNQKMFDFLDDSTLLHGGASLVGIFQYRQHKAIPTVRSAALDFQYQSRNDGSMWLPQVPYINSIRVRNKRPRCLAKVDSHFVVAYNDGCFYYDFVAKEELLKNGAGLQVNSIAHTDSFIWLGSSTGIHLFDKKNRSYVKSIGPVTKILKLKQIRERVYALTHDGLFAIRLSNKNLLYWLNQADGFQFDQLKDIRLRKDSLWIAAKTGLYRLPYDYIPNNDSPPNILLQYLQQGEERSTLQSPLLLNYGFERLLFQFDLIAPKSGNRARLHYVLEGQSEEAYEANAQHQIIIKDLLEGHYTLRVYSENEDGKRQYFPPVELLVRPPFHRTFWFYLLLTLVVSGIIGFIFWVRLRTTKRKLILERKLISSELRAIQSQMNPHFIFNALNSIQDLILKKDIRQSNKYLARFSNLMRKVLKASENSRIQLSEELDILALYLDLEKLRLGNTFSFEVEHNLQEEELENIYIPAMLLQPFVENAVKHGLLHKKGDKKLYISMQRVGNQLRCRIEDNGIGRRRSAEIRSRQAMRNNGFSTKANKKRLALLNQAQKRAISLDIIDIPNDQGTIVQLHFPI